MNASDNGGRTALMWASGNGNIDAVRYLADHCSADVDTKSNDGYTALMLAAEKGTIDVVQYLAGQCGADVGGKNRDGYTALMWVAEKGDIDGVQFLAGQCGADVNERSHFGCTALMQAARNGRQEVVRYLVEQCDADVNAQDLHGTTAVRLAADGGYDAIKRILTPLLSHTEGPDCNDTTTVDNARFLNAGRRLSCLIPASEIELTVFRQNGSIEGDFQAKWLDAKAVVKLFIPDTSHSSFDDEVRLWQRLRHPNVLKMYGACQAGPHLQFFVCEYANQGSLLEYVKLFSEYTQPPLMWEVPARGSIGS